MGCGESKHVVATTESLKKSLSRSSSRRVEDPPTATIITTSIDNVNEAKNDFAKTIDGNKNGEKKVGLIPGRPFKYQKPAMGANDEAKKKLVVVVGHDRRASKESQVSDYSTDGFEAKSEYESPLPNQEKAVNGIVVVVQECDKAQRKEEEKTKQERVGEEDGLSQRQDAQDMKATQVVHETTMAAKDIEGQESTNNTTTQENRIIEIEEIKPNKLVVRTKIMDNHT